tara:strand:- start:1167 stop:1466 length:300 start_codon:yes stop_codon:yes gene_type:complete
MHGANHIINLKERNIMDDKYIDLFEEGIEINKKDYQYIMQAIYLLLQFLKDNETRNMAQRVTKINITQKEVENEITYVEKLQEKLYKLETMHEPKHILN